MDSNEYRFSNGFMNVVGIYREIPTDKLKIKLKFKTDNGKIDKTVVIDYSYTNSKSGVLSCIPDGFQYDGSDSKFWLKLRDYIQTVVDSMEFGTSVPYGYSTVNGNVVFNFGGELINAFPGVNVLAENPKKYKVKLSKCSSSDKYEWLYKYITQSNATAALYLSAYSTFVQPLLSTANLRPVNAFCCGESGYGKSEEAKLLVSFFEGGIVGCNLGSDKSLIVKAYAECIGLPFLLDDLNKSPVARERERREDNLCRIIQRQSSAGETINKDVATDDSVSSGLIITAEYTLDSVSTMNRCILINFEKPFEDKVLTWLQKNKHLNVCLLQGFIAWICRNMARLNNLVSSYPFNFPYIENMEKSTSRKRIKASYHSLYITKVILLMYMKEAGIITREEQVETDQMFDTAINKAIEDTVEVCQSKAVSLEDMKALEFVLGVLFTPKTYKTKKLSEYKEDSNYIFFKRKGYYNFKGSRMIAHLEKSDINITIKQLVKLLKCVKLIEYSGSDASYKLPKEYGDKTRWFHVPKDVVKELQEKDMNSLFEELGLILDAEEKMKENISWVNMLNEV